MADKIYKTADIDYSIIGLLAERWSPRAFADKPIEDHKIQSLFEAARWSASCFNGQPWRFIVATQDNPGEFEKLVGCINESNRRWAPKAPLLVLTVAKTTFDADGSPNRHALYDLGLAIQNMTVQATSMGLVMHQIAGILPDVARETYHIPDDHEVMTVIAIGYQGTLDDLMERYHEREQKPRKRKPLSDVVFSGDWGNAYPLIVKEQEETE